MYEVLRIAGLLCVVRARWERGGRGHGDNGGVHNNVHDEIVRSHLGNE